MNNDIFRKKSIDSINSPEDLNSFMRITNPPLWMILFAIIILLAGAIVWGCTNTIDTRSQCIVISDGMQSYCYVHTDDLPYISQSTEIHMDDRIYFMDTIEDHGVYAETVMNDYQIVLGSYQAGETVYGLSLTNTLPEGTYEAYVVLERISPFTFLFNSAN